MVQLCMVSVTRCDQFAVGVVSSDYCVIFLYIKL